MQTLSPKHTEKSDENTNYIIRTSDFSKALLNPDLSVPHGIGSAKETKNISPAPKRFDVYRNNVVVSLIEALKAAYPSILVMMGEENFQKIARFYVSEHPPRSAMMQTFGSEFPNFVKDLPPLAKSPFLYDVARSEKAWLASYHALDAQPLTPEALSTFTPEQTMELVFTPHPAAHLIKSKYPLSDLFDYRIERPENGVDLTTSQHLLITRPDVSILTVALNDALATFVEFILNGKTLGVAITSALEIDLESSHDSPFDPAQAISMLIQTGMTTSVQINEHGTTDEI